MNSREKSRTKTCRRLVCTVYAAQMCGMWTDWLF